MSNNTGMVAVRRIDTFVLRAPIEQPVRTSFGVMRDRPAVILRLEDADGVCGWGEIWCNFPTCGAEHRGLLVDTVLAPLLLGRAIDTPEGVAAHLTQKTHILRLQTREAGPLDQAIAGIDIALWDLYARRCAEPLCRVLNPEAGETVPVYASGINPEGACTMVKRCRDEGFRAFKVKIGFGDGRDLDTLARVRDVMTAEEQLMADANQAWDEPQALRIVERLEEHALKWLEEPMPVDTPIEHWRRLASSTSVPLAGGENFSTPAEFDEAVENNVLQVVQPDICKWGGISGCLPIARRALQAQRSYCPHYLGGGVGLIASAHCLAAAGGDGLLEVDANFNPLRTQLALPFPRLADGQLQLSQQPGLGIEPD